MAEEENFDNQEVLKRSSFFNNEEEEFGNMTQGEFPEKLQDGFKIKTMAYSHIPDFVSSEAFYPAAQKEWETIEKELVVKEEDKAEEFKTGLKNGNKNRYDDSLPSEKTIVKLDGDQEYYINANWIHPPSAIPNRQFISSQAPLPETMEDFFRMIWEKEIYVIVAAVREQENSTVRLFF